MSTKNHKKKGFLVLLLLFLGVGFATVATVLTITGTVNLKPSPEDFQKNVTFSSASVDSTSAAAGTTVQRLADESGNANKKISFSTHGLKNIGEEVTINYGITNKSLYDATIGEMTCVKTAGDNDWNTYLEITPANTLNGTKINAPEPQVGTMPTMTLTYPDTIKIKMKKSFTGTPKSYTFECSVQVTASEH